MHIGVSGHQARDSIDWNWVRQKLRIYFNQIRPIDGLWTSLATGADSIAAEEALRVKIPIKVIIPHENYGLVFKNNDRKNYTRLLSASMEIEKIPQQQDKETSYLAAGQRIVDLSELIVVVWDGKMSAGKGGTADIVEYAISVGREITWIDTFQSKVVMRGPKGCWLNFAPNN